VAFAAARANSNSRSSNGLIRRFAEAVGRLLVKAVTPMALEASLSVQQEPQMRWEETDRLRRQQGEGA
jgi:hypothetical protein